MGMNCLMCKGSGRKICPACGGNLMLRLADKETEIECPHCLGKGLVPCPKCWGTGDKK